MARPIFRAIFGALSRRNLSTLVLGLMEILSSYTAANFPFFRSDASALIDAITNDVARVSQAILVDVFNSC